MATWQVTEDLPNQFDPQNTTNPAIGHLISFMTGEGNRGTVFVPNDHYNAAAVRTLIGPEADKADEIRALTSDS